MKQPRSFWVLLAIGGIPTATIAWYIGPALFALLSGNARTYSVPSMSMAPTLVSGDRFYAEKADPGKIRRGDVIVFLNESQNAQWVMRVAAMPGDMIELRNGIVILNGIAVEQRKISKSVVDEHGRKIERIRLNEQFPGETDTHEIFDDGERLGDNYPAITLRAAHYFVLGDSRDNAADSRFGPEMMGAGVIASDRITGHATTIYASKDPARIGQKIR